MNRLLSTHARNTIARNVFKFDKISKVGRPRKTTTAFMIDRILFLCRTGCQWNNLPLPVGISYKTVYHRFCIWSKNRVFESTFYELSTEYRKLNYDKPLIADTSFVKNAYGRDVVGKNPTDRGRKATKVSLLSDSSSIPLAFHFHKANKNDIQTLGHLLEQANRKTGGTLASHKILYADKGYDSVSCRN